MAKILTQSCSRAQCLSAHPWWFFLQSTQDEGRRDIRLEIPPEPEPSRFSDWSSLASPPARTSPHDAPGVQTEPSENAQNQLNVSTTGETRQERIEVSNTEGVVIAPQTDQLRDNQNIPTRPTLSPRTQRSNLESNEENVDIIPPTPMQSARSSLHADDVVLTRNVPCGSSTNDDLSRSSPRRSHDINIEGISSIHPVDSSITSGIRHIVLDNRGSSPSDQHEGLHLPRTSTVNRKDSSDSSDSDRFQRGRGYANERGRPPEIERYQTRDRRPPRRRGLPSNGRPPDRSDRGGPSDRGELPSGGGPPVDGGP